ncbi:ethanolamine utilization cobalamin adenosyltransferase [Paenibacillus sp. DMB20]|uniref:ethanolamine utilization cobalamin adenosyltransferase n=1 Tax=Paenibacillus sp. DMB20 TaxID=1642570 RepID=UPI000627DF70|nr:ethanolamine utilization cobalamin adenosyltransferase [Paenibacillus sp. DMB20]KKO51744.1 ethanolamine utilization cobalamin adenosyltransferase [Paenibacillus sp. DMB20]
MAVITESDLRKHFRNRNLKEVSVYETAAGTILTPSAKSFLTDHQIELRYVEAQGEVSDTADTPAPKKEVKLQITKNLDVEQPAEAKKRFRTLYGGFLETKPEHMTHLYGNMLVFKDHPRILFRGKLDSLETKLLEAQITCFKLNMSNLVDDLEEILQFVRRIVRCEVMNESIDEFHLLGMTPKELREQSHFPKKYFGLDHFQPSYDMGEAVVVINALRTLTRETELLAYQAFKKEHGDAEREDIIRTLNRLSSLFWIIMFRIRVGQYNT